jgi:hypothetical protein
MAKLNGKRLKWVHGIAAALFTMIWIAAAFMGWLSSVVFVSHMSMLALVYAGLSAWQGARTEEREEERSESDTGN